MDKLRCNASMLYTSNHIYHLPNVKKIQRTIATNLVNFSVYLGLNWHDLTDRLLKETKLIKDEKKEPTKMKIELPEHLQIRPVTPVEKYIKVYPSPPIPKTTQGFIGWRSSVPGLELERYYQIRSCKGAFHKDLKWPDEPSD
ncbi:ciliary microtubule inner protein 1 isoform X1 [Pelodiscus sinensis]|uniref:ciliary microtubule inner protein 1 isoform X1 n=1 Tax=Pelodiscus sinensis TaxID=13735 RepID=UPI003F6BFD41